MNLKKLYRNTFKLGNTCVTGLRGTGKDMLFANITARCSNKYISNIDYKNGSKFYEFDPLALEVGYDYKTILKGELKPFKYRYPEKVDYYISDVGIYYPSQYCGELNKEYKDIPTFMALSRHIAECNIHFNVQNLNRAWDKLREQSDIYIFVA